MLQVITKLVLQGRVCCHSDGSADRHTQKTNKHHPTWVMSISTSERPQFSLDSSSIGGSDIRQRAQHPPEMSEDSSVLHSIYGYWRIHTVDITSINQCGSLVRPNMVIFLTSRETGGGRLPAICMRSSS